MYNPKDTICAISTPIGEGGISIIRLSGAKAISIADKMFKSKSGMLLHTAASHTVHYGHIVQKKQVIDEVLVTIFRKPKTYTREDIVEISAHGGIVVSKEILALCISCGARAAEPGEFTKRAFISGRIDLTQAEAVLDIISAKTTLSAETAMAQLHGAFSEEINMLKESLLGLCAQIEAFVDFPEEDIEVYTDESIMKGVIDITQRIEKLVASYTDGEVLREGVHVVIVGKANAGKSSLLNCLLKRDRALVSDFPGTTRDALEELIEIDGILFRIVDTAGFLAKPGKLEEMSIAKTKQYVMQADVIIFMLDGSCPLEKQDTDIYNAIKNKRIIFCVNKTDLKQRIEAKKVDQWNTKHQELLHLSMKTKKGINILERALVQLVWNGRIAPKNLIVTRLRHKKALEKAGECIKNAKKCLNLKKPTEIIAYELRQSLSAIKELVGEVCSDDILNKIFSEFCIGK